MKPVVTEQELIEAMLAIGRDKEDSGVTAEQLCERTGLSRSAVCNKLKRLIRTQKVRVTSGLITNAVGRQQETFLYHWRKESKR